MRAAYESHQRIYLSRDIRSTPAPRGREPQRGPPVAGVAEGEEEAAGGGRGRRGNESERTWGAEGWGGGWGWGGGGGRNWDVVGEDCRLVLWLLRH
jgi:hypothetical protein